MIFGGTWLSLFWLLLLFGGFNDLMIFTVSSSYICYWQSYEVAGVGVGLVTESK